MGLCLESHLAVVEVIYEGLFRFSRIFQKQEPKVVKSLIFSRNFLDDIDKKFIADQL